MVDNIEDQNKGDSIAGLFSCFDLSTDESLESRTDKLGKIHDIYGHPTFHDLEDKWYLTQIYREKFCFRSDSIFNKAF